MHYNYDMHFKFFVRLVIGISLLCVPVLASAAASATATTPYPGTTVTAGTRVSFIVLPSGFSHPSYTLVDSFSGGATTGNIDSSGNFVWYPNKDDVGTHTFAISLADALGNTATLSVTVAVTAGPTGGVANLASDTVTIGYPVTFTVTTTGLSNPTYGISDSFPGSSIRSSSVSAGGLLNWTPLPQDIGVHTLTITAQDSAGFSTTVTQKFTVLPVPSLTLLNLLPGTTVRVGEKMTFVASTTGFVNPTFALRDAFWMSSSSVMIDSAGRASFTPQYKDIGAHPLTIAVSDTRGQKLNASITITVPYQPPTTATSSDTSTQTSTSAQTTQTSTGSTSATKILYVFKKYLGVGSSGADVTALQKLLKDLNYFSGDATGYFGQVTSKAVQAYQKAHGLEAVGYVGPGTRAQLNLGK